jgi:hypothetical protein
MKIYAEIILLVLTLPCTSFGQGTVLWDESVNGPLSNDYTQPTYLGALQAGTNSVIGSAEAVPSMAGWTAYDDFFTFTVPGSFQVSAVQFTVDRRVWAWIGSPTFSIQYGFVDHPSNGDLLPQWGLALLGPGTYGMYISDLDLQSAPTAAHYRLDFVSASVPEPSSCALLAVAAGLSALRLRRSYPERTRARAPQPRRSDPLRPIAKGCGARKYANIPLLLMASACAAMGQGTILWDESVNGELSMNAGSPTQLGSLVPGTNTILGATEVQPAGDGNYIDHDDYFTFVVPNGSLVGAIYFSVDKPNVWTWVGDPGFSTQLGFAANPTSGELLSQWGLSSLSPGTYGMSLANHDVQQTTSLANFRLDFYSQIVPEPGTLGLWLAGAASAGLYGLRKPRVRMG